MRARCDGDCLNCPLPDCVVDRTRKECLAEYAAARYRKRKEAGLCTQCGKNPAKPGKVMCAECAEKSNGLYAARAARRRAAGLCTKCGGPKEDPGRALCRRCRALACEATRPRQAARREALRKAGLCTACRKRPARPGRTMCAECARKTNEYVKAWKKLRK